jgi:hypothetical protein
MQLPISIVDLNSPDPTSASWRLSLHSDYTPNDGQQEDSRCPSPSTPRNPTGIQVTPASNGSSLTPGSLPAGRRNLRPSRPSPWRFPLGMATTASLPSVPASPPADCFR